MDDSRLRRGIARLKETVPSAEPTKLDRLRDAIRAIERRESMRPSSRVERFRGDEEEGRGTLPGRTIETEHGALHLVETWLEPHHRHGRAPIARALDVSSAPVATFALDPSLLVRDLSRAVFLDTETTGLAGGTGTVPFLVGVARFEDGCLRVQQLLLRSFGDEGPMLRFLADVLARASVVVTFNGKAFDWPLLRNRFVLARVPVPDTPPHLDLLHGARRIFRPRLGTTRLVELEREILGMFREDDVDGADIPGIYLDYLRTGRTAALARVVDHNRLDLVALAALLPELARRFDRADDGDHVLDRLACATVAARAGAIELAARYADGILETEGDADAAGRALVVRATLARRAKDRDEELRALEQAVTTALSGVARARVHLRLSKLLEHRRRDYAGALEHARRGEGAESDESWRRRLDRLVAKIEATRDA